MFQDRREQGDARGVEQDAAVEIARAADEHVSTLAMTCHVARSSTPMVRVAAYHSQAPIQPSAR